MPPEVETCNWQELFIEGRRQHQKNYDSQQANKRIRTRIDSFAAHELYFSNVSDGESRLRAYLQRFADGFRFQNERLRFDKFQTQFAERSSQMLASNIVGPQWTAIGPRLCREYEWPMRRMPKMLLGQAPRRFGKSVGLGTIMLNYALSVSGCILSAFSTSKRASQKLKAKVLQICIESGFEDWIYRSGEEQLYLRDPNNPNDTTRQMNFYPSNKVIDRAMDKLFIVIMLGARMQCRPTLSSLLPCGLKKEVRSSIYSQLVASELVTILVFLHMDLNAVG